MSHQAQIMLVEDNYMDIRLTLDAFKEAKLSNEINVFRNGAEALDFLFGRDKFADRALFPLPDIILLDLNMPGINGFDVLKQLKNTDKLKRIPVIILTSSKEAADRALSYDIGANSYLLKPISFNVFVEVVKKVSDYWFTLNISAPED
jgi:CheY-like chemotaxis protein